MILDGYSSEHLESLKKLLSLLIQDGAKINNKNHYNQDVEKIFSQFDSKQLVFEISKELKDDGIIEYANFKDSVISYTKVNLTKAKDLEQNLSSRLSKKIIEDFNSKNMRPEARLEDSISKIKIDINIGEYISNERIKELKDLKGKYDLKKLIRLCEELNICYKNKCYLTIPMIIRTIINHIPPIFEAKNYNEMVNSYTPKSTKELLSKLQDTLKHVADSFLHFQIREKEILPTEQQVDFKSPLDTLIGEIILKMK